MRAPDSVNDAFLNRLLAALADVPASVRPHFGRIGRQLRVSATEVAVGVYQLVSDGRLDRETLRPPRRGTRPYCQQPNDYAAGGGGPCPVCHAKPPRAEPTLTPKAAERIAREPPASTPVWCGQCDRRVPLGKALGCTSKWCSAELPPNLKECPL
jgi:hypothetical protein